MKAVPLIRPKIKKKCVSGYPAVPTFSPPTLKFFKDFVLAILFSY